MDNGWSPEDQLQPIEPLAPSILVPGQHINHSTTLPNATYYSASARPTARPTRRPFCSVCGYWGDYSCTRCGQRYCSSRCLETHSETRCLKASM